MCDFLCASTLVSVGGHLFYCTTCGIMECLNPENLNPEPMQGTFAGVIENVTVSVDGVCKNCVKTNKSANIYEPALAAFVEAAEVTHHTAFLETDRLATFRAFFTHQAVFGFVVGGSILTAHVALFKNAGNCIRN